MTVICVGIVPIQDMYDGGGGGGGMSVSYRRGGSSGYDTADDYGDGDQGYSYSTSSRTEQQFTQPETVI